MKPVQTLNPDIMDAAKSDKSNNSVSAITSDTVTKKTSKFENIVFFDVKDWEKDTIQVLIDGDIKKLGETSSKLKASKGNFKVKLCTESLTIKNAADYSDAEVVSVFVNSVLDAEVLKSFKNLKLVTTRSTGFDHIDVDYCKKNGIDVANVPSYGSNTVAEHTMALMLALLRRIPESVDRVRMGNFSPVGLTGLDLAGKTIGVIGTGKIGQNVIKYCKCFGTKVIAYDAYPNKELEMQMGFKYMDFDDVLSGCDILTFHAPYNKDTHHMLNGDTVTNLKKGAFVINTARGGLIETSALFDALKSGDIAGAALDVLEGENYLLEEAELLHKKSSQSDLKIALQNYIMVHFKNVIITPHNAFNSQEALDRIIKTTVDNILCYSQGFCDNVL